MNITKKLFSQMVKFHLFIGLTIIQLKIFEYLCVLGLKLFRLGAPGKRTFYARLCSYLAWSSFHGLTIILHILYLRCQKTISNIFFMKCSYVNMFLDLKNFVEGTQGGNTFFVLSCLLF